MLEEARCWSAFLSQLPYLVRNREREEGGGTEEARRGQEGRKSRQFLDETDLGLSKSLYYQFTHTRTQRHREKMASCFRSS